MMITLQELTGALDALYEVPGLRDYGPNGLQVEGKPEVGRVATAVTASLATIEEAVAAGVDALVVHHGLFWEGQSPLLVGAMKRRVALLLHHGISLLAYHLPMDLHSEVGNNWTAARDLGLEDLESFADWGVMGRIKPMAAGEWSERVGGYYEHQVHAALGGPEQINRVGILSGGGHKAMGAAVAAGLDCLVTGSFDLPNWDIAHEEQLHFLAVGHSNSERVGPRALAAYIKKEGILANTLFIDTLNPF